MFLIALIFLTSFGCFIASLVGLTIFFYHIYQKQNELNPTLTDEAIIISGCDSGVGLELAKYFCKSCRFKIICGFLKYGESEGYHELTRLARLKSSEDRLILVKLDLTSQDDIDELVKLIEQLKEDGEIDKLISLVNNAGIMTYGEFDWLTWQHISTQIDVNLIGTIRLTRAIVPYIIQSKGRIINVSSVNDTTVFPGLSIYSATKSALSTFSRGLGYELRKFGAHVITVRLGDFARLTNIMANHSIKQTEMWKEMNLNKRNLYKDFFEQFNKHLLDNYGMTSPKEFQDSSLFEDFKRAMLSRRPPTTITCAPLTFKIFYFVIELTPVSIQYYLLDILIQVGFKWKPPQLRHTTTI